MSDAAPLPPFAAVIVAAGRGTRAGQDMPKQFARWRGKPVLRHSVDALLAAGAAPIVIACPAGMEQATAAAAGADPRLRIVAGAETRQGSVARALEELAAFAPDLVLIHDAARPGLGRPVIARLLAALADGPGAIPVLPVIDSLVREHGGATGAYADRAELRRVQTPQAFRFAAILAAHRAWPGPPTAGDDAQVLAATGGKVALVAGDERLHKLTFAEDFMADLPMMRTGMGYDVHRLAAGEELWLCGLRLEHDRGLAGHSDADVALHAVVDAMLGAVADGDIGSHFPPSDPRWKGAASSAFVVHACERVGAAGYALANVDLTIVCEAPRIGPHRDAMRARLADLLGVDIAQVSVKATTTEQLGFTGRGEGIAAQAVVTVMRQ